MTVQRGGIKKLDLFFSFILVIFFLIFKNKVIKKAASELPETALYIGLKTFN